MKIIKWISSDDSEKLEQSFGGLGGFFQNGMRWKDYIAVVNEDKLHYAEALREEIIRLKIKESGPWHQNDSNGTPVFEDNTYASFSFRAWGDLLAAIWSSEENKDYCYMDFYC
jgi:hypothetical protein